MDYHGAVSQARHVVQKGGGLTHPWATLGLVGKIQTKCFKKLSNLALWKKSLDDFCIKFYLKHNPRISVLLGRLHHLMTPVYSRRGRRTIPNRIHSTACQSKH